MVRGQKFFTTGSIVSMAIMFVTLMLGFVEENYGKHRSFAECYELWYWRFFISVILYISFGIVAIALYKKRIKAINIVNLILTFGIYTFATFAYIAATNDFCDIFSSFLLFAALGIAFPLHFAVNIVSLTTQRFKKVEQPDSVAPVAPEKISTNNDAIDALKELKDLYDKGVLTDEEYITKRQKYVSRL